MSKLSIYNYTPTDLDKSPVHIKWQGIFFAQLSPNASIFSPLEIPGEKNRAKQHLKKVSYHTR